MVVICDETEGGDEWYGRLSYVWGVMMPGRGWVSWWLWGCVCKRERVMVHVVIWREELLTGRLWAIMHAGVHE